MVIEHGAERTELAASRQSAACGKRLFCGVFSIFQAMSKKANRTFRLCAKTLEQVEAMAKAQNRSVNNMVETILKQWVKSQGI